LRRLGNRLDSSTLHSGLCLFNGLGAMSGNLLILNFLAADWTPGGPALSQLRNDMPV